MEVTKGKIKPIKFNKSLQNLSYQKVKKPMHF